MHKGFALLRFRLAGRHPFTVIHPGPSGVFAARPPRIPVSLNGNPYTGWSGACGLTGGVAPTARPVVGDLIPLGRYAVCGPPRIFFSRAVRRKRELNAHAGLCPVRTPQHQLIAQSQPVSGFQFGDFIMAEQQRTAAGEVCQFMSVDRPGMFFRVFRPKQFQQQ